MQISLCMIVKNEEAVLGRCLESIQPLIDELIIVDTGSDDKTKEIALSYGAKVYDFKWIDDFSAARNYAFSKATCEYLLWLDADDYLLPDQQKSFQNLKDNLSAECCYNMIYVISRNSRGEINYSLRRNRLISKSAHPIWQGRVHEYMEVSCEIVVCGIEIEHGKTKPANDRNLRIYQDMLAADEAFNARDAYYYANELYQHGYQSEGVVFYNRALASELLWEEDYKNAVLQVGNYYKGNGQYDACIDLVCNSFKKYTPRADLCCLLAESYLSKDALSSAIFWFKVALSSSVEKESSTYNWADYYTWYPSLQLAVCFTRLKKYREAYRYCVKSESFRSPTEQTLSLKTYLLTKIDE